jgi:hypothetical protein
MGETHDFSRRRVPQMVGAGVGTAGVAGSATGRGRGNDEFVVRTTAGGLAGHTG